MRLPPKEITLKTKQFLSAIGRISKQIVMSTNKDILCEKNTKIPGTQNFLPLCLSQSRHKWSGDNKLS